MFVSFFHGSERKNVTFGSIPHWPYHGIISRGLLEQVEAGLLNLDEWDKLAPAIGDNAALAGSPLERAVRECGVLSYRDSAECACRFIDRVAADAGAEWTWELWCMNEGFTASIWGATALDADKTTVDRFILNVARDHRGGTELARTAGRMREIAHRRPDLSIAAVRAIDTVPLSLDSGTVDVVVTQHDWADGREIHFCADRNDPDGFYVAIDSFTWSDPGSVGGFVGKRLDAASATAINREIASFLAAARITGPAKVDINHGDVIWDGRRATIVAMSDHDPPAAANRDRLKTEAAVRSTPVSIDAVNPSMSVAWKLHPPRMVDASTENVHEDAPTAVKAGRRLNYRRWLKGGRLGRLVKRPWSRTP